MSNIFNLVTTGVLIGLGVLLPIAFHMVGAMGQIFLPMHIPVLITGLLLGGKFGLVAGILTPLLSSLLTGMPPVMPVMPMMMVELMTYGAISGYLYHQHRVSLLLSLIGAMFSGRLMALGAVYVMALLVQIKLTPIAYITGAFVTGLPGMAIQLAVVPLLVNRLLVILNNKV